MSHSINWIRYRMFSELVDVVLITRDQKGHYGEDNICLYDYPTDQRSIANLKKDIETVTKRYKLVIDHPEEKYSNVQILDIGL